MRLSKEIFYEMKNVLELTKKTSSGNT